MTKELDDQFGELKQIVPKLYEDGAKPAVIETGKTLSIVPETINAALVPLKKWIIGRKYSLRETEILLAKKLEKIESQDIVEPETYIGVPAIQSISYCMNNEVLRNLYANLLANAMNKNVKDAVHPSFVNIINQMSPVDAIVFKNICESDTRPLITLSFRFDNNHGRTDYLYNVSWINKYDYGTVCVSIDNLVRMGLIKIPEDKHYLDNSVYDKVRENVIFDKYYEKHKDTAGGKVNVEKQLILITEYGGLFYDMCVKDI